MNRQASPDLLQITGLAALVSLFSFLYLFQREQILLYGDAVAHINIARRVFDSHTPGLLQLGTAWLPLPHLLMIPFLLSDWMWQNGLGGSIPSMIAYVAGVVGIFRLTRGVMKADGKTEPVARSAAWVAAFVYGANPNLVYLQATAMTEALYLAFFIWACVYLLESVPGERENSITTKGYKKHGSLWKCGVCVAGAELTRYDGWFLAAVIGAAVIALAVRRRNDRAFRLRGLKFLVGIAVAPLLWLAYNAAVYGNPLEFANGPYSAKAIEQRTATSNFPTHPGAGDVTVAASYFLKSAQLDMAPGSWGRAWIALLLAALVLALTQFRRRWILLLLWVPLLFYALSIAYGGVPIFLPVWWPFSYYNVRYGVELLPLFAVSAGLIVASVRTDSVPEGTVQAKDPAPSATWPDAKLRLVAVCVAVLAVALSYFFLWKAQPLCFTEAWVNSRSKLSLESAVAQNIQRLPPGSEYLMYLGDHVGVFQQAGVPLRRVVNEGNHRPWKRPNDPEGLWERALADPARYVDFVITYSGDSVDREVNKSRLTLLTVIHTSGQPAARIYAARATLNQSR